MFRLSLYEVQQGLKSKQFSSEELTKILLERIEKFKTLNAYITVCADEAISAARKADERIASGDARDLEGIPLGIKDLFLT